MSIRHIARLAMVTVGLLGVTAALAGCGAEPVKEAVPPPVTQNDLTKDRIKSVQDASGSKGSPEEDAAKAKAKAEGK